MSLAVAVVDEVRRRMNAAGLSQNALAKAADMAPTLLHRAMNGERALSIDELAAVAAVLKVKPEYLLRQARTRTTPSSDSTQTASESTQV